MPYTYILECSDGTYYTGSTWNLEKRLEEHKQGEGASYTKSRLPIQLVYFEEQDRIDTAFFREKQIQNWSHKKKKALIESNQEELKNLAECRNETHHKKACLDSARQPN